MDYAKDATIGVLLEVDRRALELVGSVSAYTDPTTVPAAMPMALRIRPSPEVTGPVEGFEPSSRAIRIAGLRVLVTPATWRADTVRLGDWVTVSGQRQADQTSVAGRVDPGSRKPLAVRGSVTRNGSSIRIGALLL